MSQTIAYSYVRFSSRSQADGASRERQEEAAAAYCHEMGLKLDRSLRMYDLGVSAWTGDNAETGALAAFLDLVRSGKVRRGSVLLVENIDRISRQAPLDAFEVVKSIIRAGVTIVTLTDRQEYSEASLNSGGQVYVLWALMQRAHEESQTKSRRVRDAWARKKRAMVDERKPMTRHCPNWLKLSDDRTRYEPIPRKCALIDRILQSCIDGLGAGTIAKRLNAEEISTMSGTGIWRAGTVSTLIQNRALLGEHQQETGRGKDRRPVGDPIAGYYPAVVTKTKFYAAQKAIAARRLQRGRTGGRVNLFSGLVEDLQGTSWVLSHAGSGNMYLTSSKGLQGVEGHRHTPMRVDAFETAVCMMIKELWQRQDVPSDKSRQIDLLLGEIADAEARLGSVRDKIKRADPLTVTTLVELVPELEASRSKLQAEVERLQAEAVGQAVEVPALIDELDANPQDVNVRRRVRQAIREHLQRVRILEVEKLKRGALYEGSPALTRAAVGVEKFDGQFCGAVVAWPRGSNPEVSMQIIAGLGPVSEVIERGEICYVDEEHTVFKIG